MCIHSVQIPNVIYGIGASVHIFCPPQAYWSKSVFLLFSFHVRALASAEKYLNNSKSHKWLVFVRPSVLAFKICQFQAHIGNQGPHNALTCPLYTVWDWDFKSSWRVLVPKSFFHSEKKRWNTRKHFMDFEPWRTKARGLCLPTHAAANPVTGLSSPCQSCKIRLFICLIGRVRQCLGK